MKKENIILTIAIIIFSIITILVVNEKTTYIDNYIYNIITKYQNTILTNFFKIISNLGSVLIILIIVFGFLLIVKNIIRIIPLIIGIDIEIINLIFKTFIKRPRPEINQLVSVSNYSFPSGHSMIAMGIYGIFIYLSYKYIKNKRLKIISITLLTILILLIGISRVYLGVHYFSDVIGGYLLSFIYLIIFVKLFKKAGGFNEKINNE